MLSGTGVGVEADAVGVGVAGNLGTGDQRGAGLLDDADGIAQVVDVAVRYAHDVGAVDVGQPFGADRAVVEPGIEVDDLSRWGREAERGVTEKVDGNWFHGD